MELICSVLKAERLYSPKENEILKESPFLLLLILLSEYETAHNSSHAPNPNQTAVRSVSADPQRVRGYNQN